MRRSKEDAALMDDAVNRAEIDEVRRLLDDGVDPNVVDIAGDTPLMSAAWVGAVEIVRLLLERGADVNARGRDGMNAVQRLLVTELRDEDHDIVVEVLRGAGAEE